MKILSSILNFQSSMPSLATKATPESAFQDFFDTHPAPNYFNNISLKINESPPDALSDKDFWALPHKFALKPMREGERDADEKNCVVYMSKEQRVSYKLRAENGLLFKKDGITPLDSERFYNGHSLLFVISREGKIYAARGAHHVVHHSSFLAGDEVIAAGKIATHKGKIILISNNSGHYRPTAMHLLQALYYFYKLDVLSPEAKIDFRPQGIFNLKDGAVELCKATYINNERSQLI